MKYRAEVRLKVWGTRNEVIQPFLVEFEDNLCSDLLMKEIEKYLEENLIPIGLLNNWEVKILENLPSGISMMQRMEIYVEDPDNLLPRLSNNGKIKYLKDNFPRIKKLTLI